MHKHGQPRKNAQRDTEEKLYAGDDDESMVNEKAHKSLIGTGGQRFGVHGRPMEFTPQTRSGPGIGMRNYESMLGVGKTDGSFF